MTTANSFRKLSELSRTSYGYPVSCVHTNGVATVAGTWGCSRRQARRVVTEPYKEWMDLAFGDDNVDQRDLLFQRIARLERTARKAEEAGQFAVVVGCVAQLNKMMALGADQKGFRGHPTHYYRR